MADKIENTEEVKEVKEIPIINVDDEMAEIFITEKDTFDVEVSFYKNNEELLVESVDPNFDSKVANIKKIGFTIKKPAQGDVSRISTMAVAVTKNTNIEEISVRDFLSLEFARFICLVRGWTLKKKLTNEAIFELDPKIVSGIIAKMREKIGNSGLF